MKIEKESLTAKLRNKLGPFWSLSELIQNKENFDKVISSDPGIVENICKQCELNKSLIIEIIEAIENQSKV